MKGDAADRKMLNECCRSHLQSAVRSTERAVEFWPACAGEASAIIHRLRSIKLRVKMDLLRP